MNQLFELGNRYLEHSDWKDLALVKFCLFSMGVAIGAQIVPKHKKTATAAAAAVFAATYVPLMTKLYTVAKEQIDSAPEEKEIKGE